MRDQAVTVQVPEQVVAAVAKRAAAIVLRAQQQHEQQRWLDVAGAAAHLACSKDRLYKLVQRRAIPHEHEGRRLLFDRNELDAWVRRGGAR